MSNRWVIGGAIAILALLVAACVVTVLKIDIAPEARQDKRPVRKQNLGEGIRISQHGLYGVDLVSIGKAHMRKLRKGPFSIGAINELVLENVSLALPEELWKEKKEKVEVKGQGRDEGGGEGNGKSGTFAKTALEKLGVNASSLKMGGKIPRFSALSIKGLRVSRIDGTNAVPWFAAMKGRADRAGLVLSNGWSVEGGKTNAWKEALLVVEPKLSLHW